MDVPLAVVYALSLRVGARARAGARSSDVRLDAVASIGSDRAAAAKASNRIGAGS